MYTILVFWCVGFNLLYFSVFVHQTVPPCDIVVLFRPTSDSMGCVMMSRHVKADDLTDAAVMPLVLDQKGDKSYITSKTMCL